MGKIVRQFRPFLATVGGGSIVIALAWGIWTIASPAPRPTAPTRAAIAVASTSTAAQKPVSTPKKPTLYQYIEVVTSCGVHYEGTCVNVRSGPGTQYPKVLELRKGMVLQVAKTVERGGRTWYKIAFTDWLRYPERVTSDWYVAADYVRAFSDPGTRIYAAGEKTTTKEIIVDRTKQMLYAYDGDTLFMKEHISTGIELTPTPRGTFTIFKKTPSRYMQGPIPGITDEYYDMPGVPWNMYFTQDGAAIHGAYWHNDFGHVHSNGCVNLPLDRAKKLYEWADLGTKVIVRD